MNKEFIPYQQALALKKLGFDEEVEFYKDLSEEIFDMRTPNDAPCILWQQAFRWFREKYNLKGYVEPVEYLDGTPDTYHWSIFNNCNSGNDQLTHEEAEQDCLEKLCEIVEQKQK
jgi:hypothetical protein